MPLQAHVIRLKTNAKAENKWKKCVVMYSGMYGVASVPNFPSRKCKFPEIITQYTGHSDVCDFDEYELCFSSICVSVSHSVCFSWHHHKRKHWTSCYSQTHDVHELLAVRLHKIFTYFGWIIFDHLSSRTSLPPSLLQSTNENDVHIYAVSRSPSLSLRLVLVIILFVFIRPWI